MTLWHSQDINPRQQIKFDLADFKNTTPDSDLILVYQCIVTGSNITLVRGVRIPLLQTGNNMTVTLYY